MSYAPGVDLVVVSYHSQPDLRAWCKSLRDADLQVDAAAFLVTVETTPEEVTETRNLAFGLANERLYTESLALADNTGYAVACNAAAELGAAEVIAFFNADTRITKGCIESCLDLLWSDRDIAIVGPKQVDERGRITHAGIFGTLERPSITGWLTHDRGQFSEVRTDAISVSGAAYFIKREVWDELTWCPTYREVDPESRGAFLTTFLYHEETWCSVHALAHGHKVAYNGASRMIHRWHGAIGPAGEGTHFQDSQKRFRAACDQHSIPHN